jgi:hypothetical protein
MSSEDKDLISDTDYENMEVQVEYQRLLDSPDELEALIDRLGIPQGEMLTSDQVWEEAHRLWSRRSSTDDQD